VGCEGQNHEEIFGGIGYFGELVSENTEKTLRDGEKMAEIPKYNGKSALQCGVVRILRLVK